MNMQANILVCDDDAELAALVADLLAREGMRTVAFSEPAKALEYVQENPVDLAVLDIMMPGMDGYELARRIDSTTKTPFLFLSAKDEEFDKVLAFSLGAQDFITKPFKPRELVIRAKVRLAQSMALKRATSEAGDLTLRFGEFSIDTLSHSVELLGEDLPLTPKEFDCLKELVKAQGAPVSSRAMFETVWNLPFDASSSNSVMVHIRHLRAKIEKIDSSRQYIETVWGVGYRLSNGGR